MRGFPCVGYCSVKTRIRRCDRLRGGKNIEYKSGDEDGIWGFQAADWVHTYHHSQAGLRCWPRICPPAVWNPKAGCRESLNWMSRWGERDRDAHVGALRARGAGFTALVESRHPARLSRSLSTAVSRLDAVVEEVSFRGSYAGVCMVSVPSARFVGDCGWQGGRWESLVDGDGGGEGCCFLNPSQPVQDALVSQR